MIHVKSLPCISFVLFDLVSDVQKIPVCAIFLKIMNAYLRMKLRYRGKYQKEFKYQKQLNIEYIK